MIFYLGEGVLIWNKKNVLGFINTAQWLFFFFLICLSHIAHSYFSPLFWVSLLLLNFFHFVVLFFWIKVLLTSTLTKHRHPQIWTVILPKKIFLILIFRAVLIFSTSEQDHYQRLDTKYNREGLYLISSFVLI